MASAETYSVASNTSTNAISSSSSSSYILDTSRHPSSPVSHRNLNKRVAQQEASEFLSCSEGGNLDDPFDDIDGFGLEVDLDENVFQLPTDHFPLPPPPPPSVQTPQPQQPISSTRGGHRSSQSLSLRRGRFSPLANTAHRRSRNTVLTSSGQERPRKACYPRSGGRKRNLLNFILELLTTRQTCVEWVDKPKQVFQIVNPDQLTRLWGEHKNNIKMSFDSLSRSLR